MIGDTIENMLNQSTPPFELIVVDDGSTDDSVKIIRSFGDKVMLIQQANHGPGVARNNGFNASSGDFIQFMDSDDLASKNKLESQLNALLRSGADFAYCPWARCRIEENKIAYLDKVLQSRAVPEIKSMLEWFLSGWSLVFQNCLFKRSLIETTGGYRSDLMPSEDSEYFLRMLLANAKPIHTPDCLVFYREHNINKITASGTSAVHRANDWTMYLEIAGEMLKSKLTDFRLSTKIALSASVQNHISYCKQNGLKQLSDNNPLHNIKIPAKAVVLQTYNLYQKSRRKILNSPDFNRAFFPVKPGEIHRRSAKEIGFNI